MRDIKRGILILAGLLLLGVQACYAQFNFKDEPVLDIIKQIEEHTSTHFLYRDALLADVTLSFKSNKEHIYSDFNTELAPYNLSLQYDKNRKQAIIFQSSKKRIAAQEVSIKGQVVDASSGERLPFATIRWKEQRQTTGTSANESGTFNIERSLASNTFTVLCSYVGYQPKKVTLDFSETQRIDDFTFRLEPKRIDGNEIIVTGASFNSDINNQLANLVDIGTFSAMGENSSMRALQTLPSVSKNTAVSDGLHVRGSPSDAFRVLVDGITVFNQSHLFGLVDSFNGDVLKRSGFFYDVSPARLKAPPGGTLSLITKSGSLNEFTGSAGISNASARLTLGGPIKKGRSSWLVSGRKSYLNTVHWFDNDRLISHGLDVNRNQQVKGSGLVDLRSRLVRPGKTDASFFDLHSKLYFEGKEGNQLILSGYFGGDDTQQNAKRLFRNISSASSSFNYEPVTSANNWQNGAASAQYKQWFNDNTYSTTTLGTSIYETSFTKDDFTYTTVNPLNQKLQSFVFLFENESVLNEFKFNQEVQYHSQHWKWTSGLSYNYFIGEYYENSFDRPGYFSSRKSHQLDAYLQLDSTDWKAADFFAGLRAHYFSNGEYLRWSPRLKFTLFPDSKLSLSTGFSRNHQFLNQIKLKNTVTSNVWILAGNKQPPTSVNYFTAGAYYSISDHFYAQVEGYTKKFEHLRLHELNTFSLSNTFNSNPFYSNNDGKAKGLEFLFKSSWPVFSLTQALSISEVTLSNPSVNNGESYHPNWDRTYQYTATAEINPLPHISLFGSWTYASGRANRLATLGSKTDERLAAYKRTDLSIEYKRSFQKNYGIEITATVFNLLDRENPWYRKESVAVNESSSPNQFQAAPVRVFDIGLQPSFNVRFTF